MPRSGLTINGDLAVYDSARAGEVLTSILGDRTGERTPQGEICRLLVAYTQAH
jgi:hypothetical protein